MTRIVFADEKVKKAFEKLKHEKAEKRLYDTLMRAFKDIEESPTAFIHIRQKLIPKEYVSKYKIDNLWKYDLPNGWRLLYSLGRDEIEIIAIVLEWLDHKNYEKRFGYRKR
ncbi:MAG: hypothetical protein NTY20_00080 [Candidatus Aenigmarchaeota archaeon]|nr:hypothetical protein [Candidatus Aenigmarchaeota archaeon]